MAKKKRDPKSIRIQKAALAIGAVTILAIVGYVMTLVMVDMPLGEYVAGEHYQELENPRRLRGDKVQITEFFSYACVHCYNLDDDLADWVEANSDRVEFERLPAATSEAWSLLARGYYASEVMGTTEALHMRLFHAIHERGKTFNNKEQLADFHADNGQDRDAFLEAYASADVRRRFALGDQLQRRYRVASVPTLIVGGKYRVTTGRSIGLARVLDVVDHLVAKELEERAGPSQPDS